MKEPTVGEPLQLQEGEIVGGSWRVGDAGPGPILAFAHDLDHMVHDEAVAFHGPMRACRWAYFSNGEGPFGRSEFFREIGLMGGDAEEVAKAAIEWDAC